MTHTFIYDRDAGVWCCSCNALEPAVCQDHLAAWSWWQRHEYTSTIEYRRRQYMEFVDAVNNHPLPPLNWWDYKPWAMSAQPERDDLIEAERLAWNRNREQHIAGLYRAGGNATRGDTEIDGMGIKLSSTRSDSIDAIVEWNGRRYKLPHYTLWCRASEIPLYLEEVSPPPPTIPVHLL